MDTTENQKAWMDVILHQVSEQTDNFVALRSSLHKEFGNAVVEQTTSSSKFDEKMRDAIKVKADAVKQRISAQLEEWVNAEARHSGRLPPVIQADENGGATRDQ